MHEVLSTGVTLTSSDRISQIASRRIARLRRNAGSREAMAGEHRSHAFLLSIPWSGSLLLSCMTGCCRTWSNAVDQAIVVCQ
jgi:hypothetical protein